MTAQTVDRAKAEAFAGKMLEVLNSGFLAPLISIGHRTRLFDKIAEMPPSTSAEIAGKAGLDERYVREWLGAMVVGGIIEYDAQQKTYRLPPEHAGFVTRAGGPNNMAFFCQYIALVGFVEDKVVESFQRGGGVPYSAYPKFQELQAEESAALYDASLVGVIIPLVPGMTERLKKGVEVADVGCGQGHASNIMAKEYPRSRFTGLDFSEEGVAAGRAEAKAWGLKNSSFEMKDIAVPPLGSYDFITAFDTIHDQAKPRQVLKNLAGSLKPGGVCLIMDIAGSSKLEENIGAPFAPLIYSASVMHCMTVSLAQGGEGLGTAWGEQKAQELIREAGFKNVEVKRLPDDAFHVFYVCTK
jgi:2-polyprenyl-3-methyl-5-hydroxy-6-metoxy-1,4-benzoquinol methylase